MSHPDQFFGDKTYSQFGEDLILLNVFAKLGIKKGKYFDVGAHHPHNISNTALLYERGWRGVCIEANPNHIRAFEEARPEDNILNVGVGTITGEMTFYMIDLTEQKSVPVISLESLFIQFGTPDFLSIDIEGLDYDVLAHSLVWRKPKVVCVENHGKEMMFDDLLKRLGYDKIFNTVANGIYIYEDRS